MDLLLKDKIAFVSGSASGIGFAIAVCLAKEGAVVTINAEKDELVEKAIAKINKIDPKLMIEGIVADLTKAEGAQLIYQKLPKIDILINNLGIYEPKEFENISDEDWYRIFEINVMSGIRLSRYYISGMKKQNWGRILFISSESGIETPKEMIHYGVTKTAQIALAKGIAETTSGTSVTVNSILPGPTDTPSLQIFIEQLAKEWKIPKEQVEAKYFDKVRPGSLLKRFEQPEEIAAFVVFLCSPLASAINGAALRVDGGCVKAIL